MFLLNSRLPLVTATCGPFPVALLDSRLRVEDHRHPFSRSYGANLPISLGRVIPTPLSLLSRPTCSGSRYGHGGSFPVGFSPDPGISRTAHTDSSSPLHPLLLITRLQGLQGLSYLGLPRAVTNRACVAARTPVAPEY